jgi:hypothetical protein
MRLIYLIACAITLVCTGCLQPYYTINELPEERLEFGIGANGETIEHYALLPSGQVLKQNADQDTFHQVKILDKPAVKTIFFQRDSIRLLSYDCYTPGSTYKFINQFNSSTEHNLAWGAPGKKVPESISYFYNLLLETTKEEKKGKNSNQDESKQEKTESFGW